MHSQNGWTTPRPSLIEFRATVGLDDETRYLQQDKVIQVQSYTWNFRATLRNRHISRMALLEWRHSANIGHFSCFRGSRDTKNSSLFFILWQTAGGFDLNRDTHLEIQQFIWKNFSDNFDFHKFSVFPSGKSPKFYLMNRCISRWVSGFKSNPPAVCHKVKIKSCFLCHVSHDRLKKCPIFAEWRHLRSALWCVVSWYSPFLPPIPSLVYDRYVCGVTLLNTLHVILFLSLFPF